MNSRDAMLGVRTAVRRFSLESDPKSAPTTFEKRLREIEAGAASLNLSADSVHLAAEIAAFEPELNDDDRISLILLVVISLAALEEGSTRFPVTGPQARQPLERMLEALCGEAFGFAGRDAIRNAIENLLNSRRAAPVIGTSPDDYKPLLYLPPFIYHHRIRCAETALAQRLADLLASTREDSQSQVQESLSEIARHPTIVDAKPMALSQEQRHAVASAASTHLAVISGGPGTGKTSIVLAILRLLVRLGVKPTDIALAAPTGKAAYRIGESIREGLSQMRNRDSYDEALWINRPEPSTIHRLLGYSPSLRRFRHHRNNPLSASVVIVDEGSMLDLNLMERLVDAIRPAARLIILGDADQLPSVAAGAVFRDLIPGAEETSRLSEACVRLTHSYRMEATDDAGSVIFRLARAINEGNSDAFSSAAEQPTSLIVRRSRAEQVEFAATEWLDDAPGQYGALLDHWYSQRVRGDFDISQLRKRDYSVRDGSFDEQDCEDLRRLFRHCATARILCVTRVLDSGTDKINARLHRRAAEDGRESPERVPFIVGEPIMVLRNDYDRRLFNGDQGLVLRVRSAEAGVSRMAVFPKADNFVAFQLDALREDLELCYAMTVHKAQGSEFDSVAVILPEKDIPLLTREILYTAVSRARKSVAIAGSEAVIRAGISRRMERYCGLREQIASLIDQRPVG